MRIAMLGLGLIGGSVGRAAGDAGMDVVAWTPSGRGPAAAAGHGIEPAASLADAVAGADLVVLAAPPIASLELVDRLAAGEAGELPADVVITDVVSTKAAIVDRAHRAGLRFVGGHPLAGREIAGYDAAEPDLFRDRPWVVVPPDPADEAAVARVEALVATCGAKAVRMTAADHDRAVAAVSHLPLLVAAALVESVGGADDWDTAAPLAAGGWASMTRLARGDVEMGAGILRTNAAEVAGRLNALADVLREWSADLAAVDSDRDAATRVRSHLESARALLEDRR